MLLKRNWHFPGPFRRRTIVVRSGCLVTMDVRGWWIWAWPATTTRVGTQRTYILYTRPASELYIYSGTVGGLVCLPQTSSLHHKQAATSSYQEYSCQSVTCIVSTQPRGSMASGQNSGGSSRRRVVRASSGGGGTVERGLEQGKGDGGPDLRPGGLRPCGGGGPGRGRRGGGGKGREGGGGGRRQPPAGHGADGGCCSWGE